MVWGEGTVESLVIERSSFWFGKRVLITGHTGFKGSWLLLWLRELGAEVWGFSLKPEKEPNLFTQIWGNDISTEQWHHYEGNILDIVQLKKIVEISQPEIVFHLAAQPLVKVGYEDPINTWSTNVIGSLNVLEALREISHKCAVVMITTDKVYENSEALLGFRENDRLGGFDPYSASKAAAEIAIASWRKSFCGLNSYQNKYLRISTARAGNVIGGGDWSENRIVPDVIRSLKSHSPVLLRNPDSYRPWQHVLDPLFGYMLLAKSLFQNTPRSCESFNFGPSIRSNRKVRELVDDIFKIWPGTFKDINKDQSLHEAKTLHIVSDKSYQVLKWESTWDYSSTIDRTIKWYLNNHKKVPAIECCLADIHKFQKDFIKASNR